MQQNVQFRKKSIGGELKKVTDYTQFSGTPDEQKGYYLAFKLVPPKDVVPSSEVLKVNDVTLDGDRIHITRVAKDDKTFLRKQLKISCDWTNSGHPQEFTLDISTLKLLD